MDDRDLLLIGTWNAPISPYVDEFCVFIGLLGQVLAGLFDVPVFFQLEGQIFGEVEDCLLCTIRQILCACRKNTDVGQRNSFFRTGLAFAAFMAST
jgi:hypothetical protein